MRYLSMLVISMICLPAFAGNLNCENRIAAIYSPGPNWADLTKVSPEHIQYITARLETGDISEAGPFISDKGATGGLMIYTTDNTKSVEELVKADPLIAKGVSTYELRMWMKCTK